MAKKVENLNVNSNVTPEMENDNIDSEKVVNSVVKPEKSDKEKDEAEAQETAKKLKKEMVRIKVPVDPMNPKDLMVSVSINGYKWLIKRGETVEVPEEVAKILENAKYI